MFDFARLFAILGIFFLFLAGCIFLFQKVGFPFGKLFGDLSYQGKNFSLYFPIVSSIVLSIVATIVLNLFFYFFRK